MTQKFVSSTKMGPDGRPIQESYQSKARGVYGGGPKPELVERKQMYKHTGTGYEKAAHERMYQGKGRKIVIENDRNSGSQNSYNYYKGMREIEGSDFDKSWENAAQQYGFRSDTQALPYGNGVGKQSYKRSRTDNDYDNSDSYMDDNRRGYFQPSYLKGQDMPVHINKPDTHVERLMPVDTSNRMDIPNNRVSDPNAPLALPDNNNRGTAPRHSYNTRSQVNYRAPNRGNKRARVG